MNTTDLSQFSPKWQFRFNFFRQHGPQEPRLQAGLEGAVLW